MCVYVDEYNGKVEAVKISVTLLVDWGMYEDIKRINIL